MSAAEPPSAAEPVPTVDPQQGLDLPAGVTLQDGPGTTPVVRVATAACEALVHLHGAHLTSWRPAGAQEDLLWTSDSALYAPGSAIRGGIPVCHPWFAAGPDGTWTPMHGLVRTLAWHLVEVSAEGEDVHVVLCIDSAQLRARHDAADLTHLPARPFTLTARFILGAALEVRLTTEHTAAPAGAEAQRQGEGTEPQGEGTEPQRDGAALEFEEALHTYLRVGDVATASVEGLDGASYYDKNADAHDHQHGTLTLPGPTDAVFTSRADLTVHDPTLARTIRIATEHSGTTVVWNPGRDQEQVCDISDGAWRDFLCVESANVGGNRLRLEPGESHTLSVRYTIEG